LAVAYVKGVQGRQIGTSTKHYAGNNQEWERTTISAEIGERALREIYLPAFKAAVQEADTWTIMGAYNKVRGDYCCANKYLLTDILKEEWGFKGLVVSDWNAVHSTVKSANAGLDLEMPGPGIYFGPPLLEAVQRGDVSEERVDDMVRRILRVAFKAGLFDRVEDWRAGALDTPAHRQLARELAVEGMVLLKNEGAFLPLDKRKLKTLAVIGPNAGESRLGGGGSSTVTPLYDITPLEGIRDYCGDDVDVLYARGSGMMQELEPIDALQLHPGKGGRDAHGLLGAYYNNGNFSGEPVFTRVDSTVDFNWADGGPGAGVAADGFSVRWTGKLKPVRSGRYRLGATSDDGARLYLNGELIVDHWGDHGPETKTAEVELKANRDYDVRLEYHENGGGAMVRLGWIGAGESILQQALSVAEQADAVIVVGGLSNAMEGEGFDKHDMSLPADQVNLIKQIAQVNSNTVVTLINGTPVRMDVWIDRVPAVLEAWYPGQEGGHALADILFGRETPSGKLPVTFPRRLEDTPAYHYYPGKDGTVTFGEGLLVGYRYYDTRGVDPLFPFGHGLSYTKFTYDNLRVEPRFFSPNTTVTVSVDVANTGLRPGKEAVQLYVTDRKASLSRPAQELKAFQKIALHPGETKTVVFKLKKEAFSFYDPTRKRWVMEPGLFDLRLGSSSRDIRLQDVLEYRESPGTDAVDDRGGQ
jgi:beta-glucosidase